MMMQHLDDTRGLVGMVFLLLELRSRGVNHSGKQRAFLYESSGKPVCINLVEFVGGVH